MSRVEPLGAETAGGEVDYPDSDGVPLESDLHRDGMLELIAAVQSHFRDDPEVYASGNLFIYYVEGDPSKCVGPDFFVVRGVASKRRPYYKLWVEGRGPELVVEISSRKTIRHDLGAKRELYAELGVKEYVLFDPQCEELEALSVGLDPQMQVYLPTGGRLERAPVDQLEDGSLSFHSEVIGLDLRPQGPFLRLWDPAARRLLPLVLELGSAAKAEARRAKAEARRASELARQVKDLAREKERAEAEAARLRRELERLRPCGEE